MKPHHALAVALAALAFVGMRDIDRLEESATASNARAHQLGSTVAAQAEKINTLERLIYSMASAR